MYMIAANPATRCGISFITVVNGFLSLMLKNRATRATLIVLNMEK
jgi:hypothetical protein